MSSAEDALRLLEKLDDKVTEIRDNVTEIKAHNKHAYTTQQELKADVKEHASRITRVETRSNTVIAGVSMVVSGIVTFLFYMLRGITGSGS